MIHLLTGEYPPLPGGVSDYSALIAAQLAAQSEPVHVWTRGHNGTVSEGGVWVHRIAGGFSPLYLAQLDRELEELPGPHRILVQWTPHSFGFRSLNAMLPLWLWKRARMNHDRVELMVHEPFLEFARGRWRRNTAAAVHRFMMATLLDAAAKVWVAIPAWESRLRPWCLGKAREFAWLPVPSNVEPAWDARAIITLRSQLAPARQPIIGHFGSYREDVAALLEPAIALLLQQSNALILLTGLGSDEFADRFQSSRVLSTGALRVKALSEHLSACDVLLQPYPDGISSRRGSAMAALALGMPMVSNLGHLSEDFWDESGAVQLALSVSAEDLTRCTLQLVEDLELRLYTSQVARDLYRARFDVPHTIDALLGGGVPRLALTVGTA